MKAQRMLLLMSLYLCTSCGHESSPYEGLATTNANLPEQTDMSQERSTSPYSGVVVINELMSSNDSAHMDEQGEFDDWLELFNTGDTDLNLSGWRIADENAYDDAFEFSDTVTIDAQGYLLVWADNDTEQGPLHASFKLSADGEAVWLYDAEGLVVQHLTFGAFEADTTYGRQVDGMYETLPASTPGAANQ